MIGALDLLAQHSGQHVWPVDATASITSTSLRCYLAAVPSTPSGASTTFQIKYLPMAVCLGVHMSYHSDLDDSCLGALSHHRPLNFPLAGPMVPALHPLYLQFRLSEIMS
jgi:hypothetical protein